MDRPLGVVKVTITDSRGGRARRAPGTGLDTRRRSFWGHEPIAFLRVYYGGQEG